jgi:hypothetical protein
MLLCRAVPQGEPVLVVSSLLRFSSSLLLRGLPDAPGLAGSWVLMPLVGLQGPGSLEFQVMGLCFLYNHMSLLSEVHQLYVLFVLGLVHIHTVAVDWRG